ncbi:hypothetical protein ASPZODRAFT_160229 [Penicilliopsis zonata CBS 506.65]|uniref:6-methylsalicylic acid synthase n=1 Tax=Penicilliopsis zonata CBS 506.65 TaxID=1073090 RepID=A0A1L9SDY2_9EURO|nr:hypothetical protein ASPZODRAFT_160229 [Penicilliopsis zonata CBS 506.65]OJJ45348.1 hypothetical protein ASPZODRAFT_160229 [Penicilliopsis zonata CBS 506.65]
MHKTTDNLQTCSSSGIRIKNHVSNSSSRARVGVAIVGMACRVAGGVCSLDALWEMLMNKTDASGPMPSERLATYYARHPRNPAVLEDTVSRGYFIDDLDGFDALFFGISPKEAEQMDPQQRLSLEVAWEALENAGLSPKALAGSDTSVFWGVTADDYGKLLLEDLPAIDAWMGIGTCHCGVPNRISYHLNLLGPSAAVDGACASSLIALHSGVRAIQAGESKVALIGGVNAVCGPGFTRSLQVAGALSLDGRCCSFDEAASGYGRADGVGAVVLKNLADAVHDQDNILAVVRGTALGHDGRKNGIMSPNGLAQQLVARNALQAAGMAPSDIAYVEAHATSTPVGDPVEVAALAAVYGAGRTAEDPCLIGSIKPNIGHVEAGAGLLGLIKAVLILNKGIVPPQANLTNLNSRIQWEGSGLEVVREPTPWPVSTTQPPSAAICSYGYGGAVSHAVISLPANMSLPSEQPQPQVPLLLFSAPQEKRLRPMAQSLLEWLQSDDSDKNNDWASICTTLATRRSHHDFRVALMVTTKADAVEALSSLIDDSSDSSVSSLRRKKILIQDRVLPVAARTPGVVWVFSGHGAQWADMGKSLLGDPIFRQAIEPLDEIVRHQLEGASPIAWLTEGDFLGSTDRVQILTVIMQLGLAALLRHRGIVPSAIIGHSVGEIAAAVQAGVLSSTQAVLLVTRRAILYRQVMGQGAMILVNRSMAEMQERFSKDPSRPLTVSIDASLASCVVSGTCEAIAAFAEECKADSIQAYSVQTDIAFHSPLLDPIAAPLREAIDPLFPTSMPSQPPHTRLYSTSQLDPRAQDPRDADYWVNNTVGPVFLTSAVKAAAEDGFRVFMEVSSHPVVGHSIRETLLESNINPAAVLPTMRRDQPAEETLLHAMATLHCHGIDVDWRRYLTGPWAVEVPNTPWFHQNIRRPPPQGSFSSSSSTSLSPSSSSLSLSSMSSSPEHRQYPKAPYSLLGPATTVAGTKVIVHSSALSRKAKPFPGEHVLLGTEILPVSILINTFWHAAKSSSVLEDVVFRVPLELDPSRHVQVVVDDDRIKLLAQKKTKTSSPSWITHTTGRFGAAPTANLVDSINITAITVLCGSKLADGFCVNYLDQVGLSSRPFPWVVEEQYGSSTQMIACVKLEVGEAGKEEKEHKPSSSWASLLDAAMSIGSSIFHLRPELRVPVQIKRITNTNIDDPPQVGWVYVRRDPSPDSTTCHIQIADETGQLLVILDAVQYAEVEENTNDVEHLVHRICWPPVLPAETPLAIEQLILVSPNLEVTNAYIASLSEERFSVLHCKSPNDLQAQLAPRRPGKGTAVVYVPNVRKEELLPEMLWSAANRVCWELLGILQDVLEASPAAKIFVLVSGVVAATAAPALTLSPLLGLSRILAGEYPDTFGGLIDVDGLRSGAFPLPTVKYVQGADIILLRDGVPRTARLRPLAGLSERPCSLLPQAEGTYIITGGLGALGIATAEFLVEEGARRLVLISRRALPPRQSWPLGDVPGSVSSDVLAKIQGLERRGVSVHVLALDMAADDAAAQLKCQLKQLALPTVRGVVHAAGVVENQLAQRATPEAFERVMAPKIRGALALHSVFPPGTLDFLVLFSSAGHLFGYPGQSSYGAANTFLEALATYRRQTPGDNSVALAWTAWREMGMSVSTGFMAAELESKALRDMSPAEAFAAWVYIGQHDIGNAAIIRSRPLAEDEPLSTPLLSDVIVRRRRHHQVSSRGQGEGGGGDGGNKDFPAEGLQLPPSGPELMEWLETQIRTCVAEVLGYDLASVDTKTALVDMGLDSVMTIGLRHQFQQTFQINTPAALTWSHPTVTELVGWFAERLSG